MPTARPRYQITETPAVAHALNVAASVWPTEPRSKLLLRLIHSGSEALESVAHNTDRLAAVDSSAGKYADAFDDNFLAQLRQDWPE